jgi:hypothetical protein
MEDLYKVELIRREFVYIGLLIIAVAFVIKTIEIQMFKSREIIQIIEARENDLIVYLIVIPYIFIGIAFSIFFVSAFLALEDASEKETHSDTFIISEIDAKAI